MDAIPEDFGASVLRWTAGGRQFGDAVSSQRLRARGPARAGCGFLRRAWGRSRHW